MLMEVSYQISDPLFVTLSQISQWLKAPDPTTNHNNARDKRHAETGLWLIKSPDFMQWLTNESSFMWVYGAVGCGKTVLSSTIIQHIYRLRRSNQSHAVAFYYFDFNDVLKQDSAGMIRSLILQLSVQLYNKYAELNDLQRRYGAAEPPMMALLITLRRIMEGFVDCHIVIDALDECPPGSNRDSVLDALSQIDKWSIKHLHLLVTSRDEFDIRTGLEEINVKQLFIRSKEVDADIAKYVAKNLRSQRSLRKWENYFEEIESKLTSGAKGMFRWVECQFASLKTCRSLAQLKQTLESLPDSLFETYFRIFQRIDKNAAGDVKRILTWLCFAKQPITLDAMNTILAVRTESIPKYDKNRCYVDKCDILGVCPGLVSVDTTGQQSDNERENNNESAHQDDQDQEPSRVNISTASILRIAHFSVFEYLVTDQSQDFMANEFHLSWSTAHADISKCCLVLMNEWSQHDKNKGDIEATFPMRFYCARQWYQHLKESGEREDARTMAVQFLSSTSTYAYWTRIKETVDEDDVAKDIVRRTPTLGSAAFYVAGFGLAETLRDLISQGYADVDEFVQGSVRRQQHDFTLLQTASRYGNFDCVKTLLDLGANPDFLPPASWSAFQLACKYEHVEIARLLIDRGCRLRSILLHDICAHGLDEIAHLLIAKGASLNKQDNNLDTPLHLAVRRGCANTITLLTQNKADKTINNRKKRNPLHEALLNPVLPPRVWEELYYPASLSECDNTGSTALLTIAADPLLEDLDSRMKAVEWILKHEGVIDAQNSDGFTSLHLALGHGNFQLARCLLDHGCLIDIRSNSGFLPLHALANCGRDLDVAQNLDMDFPSLIDDLTMSGIPLDEPGGLHIRVAHLTMLTERPNLLESFVLKGANFLHLDDKSRTALDYFIARVPSLGFRAALYKWILGEQAVTDLFAEFGIVEGFVDETSISRYDYDNDYEHLTNPRVELLTFKLGGSGEISGDSILLPLRDPVACRMLLGIMLIYISAMSDNSAHINEVFQHRTAFELSSERFSELALESYFSAQLRGYSMQKQLPLDNTTISKMNLTLKVSNLLGAFHSKDIDFVRHQFDGCPGMAEIETFLASHGSLILSFAFQFDEGSNLFALELLEFLILKGADPNKRDRHGNTVLGEALGLCTEVDRLIEPLHKSMPTEKIELIKYLVRCGADTNIKNRYGRTPLEYAREIGDSDILENLLHIEGDFPSQKKTTANNETGPSLIDRSDTARTTGGQNLASLQDESHLHGKSDTVTESPTHLPKPRNNQEFDEIEL